jgi:hypothetical protein
MSQISVLESSNHWVRGSYTLCTDQIELVVGQILFRTHYRCGESMLEPASPSLECVRILRTSIQDDNEDYAEDSE